MYYNRCVPLPLGLVDISIRLASGYYRQPAALRHDIQLLASNARLFNADDAPIIKVADGAAACWPTLLPCVQPWRSTATAVSPMQTAEGECHPLQIAIA